MMLDSFQARSSDESSMTIHGLDNRATPVDLRLDKLHLASKNGKASEVCHDLNLQASKQTTKLAILQSCLQLILAT